MRQMNSNAMALLKDAISAYPELCVTAQLYLSRVCFIDLLQACLAAKKADFTASAAV